MILTAETQRGDSSKQHLYPGHHGHGLSNNSVSIYGDLPDLPMKPFCDVELQIYPENDLYSQHQHEPIGKRSVNILRKDSALV
jgi:hypothetical protein